MANTTSGTTTFDKTFAIDEIIENKNTNDEGVQTELAYQFYDDVVNYIKSGRFKINNL